VTGRGGAALRLPPLTCGCRDPESLAHLRGRCRYAAGQLAGAGPAAEAARARTLAHFLELGYDVSWTHPLWVIL
jgi:hypothetical protein